jgi:hypothetical protein
MIILQSYFKDKLCNSEEFNPLQPQTYHQNLILPQISLSGNKLCLHIEYILNKYRFGDHNFHCISPGAYFICDVTICLFLNLKASNLMVNPRPVLGPFKPSQLGDLSMLIALIYLLRTLNYRPI